MKHLFDDFFSFLLPKRCFYCKQQLLRSEIELCLSCEFALPKHHSPSKICMLLQNIHIAAAFLKFEKTGITQELIHKIKYHSNTRLASYIGELFANSIQNEIGKADFLIPVPLHPKKQKERGFNQSEAFARGMEMILQTPTETKSLQRVRYTESQTHKNKKERKQNVKDCFKLCNETSFEGKHIILLDDVITTGATLEACMHAFKEVPNIQISILCIAMA